MNRAKRLTLGRDEKGRRVRSPARPWSGTCALTYDLSVESWPDPQPADLLVLDSGRAYLIGTVRRVQSTQHPRRFALTVERISPARVDQALADGAGTYPMRWYKR